MSDLKENIREFMAMDDDLKEVVIASLSPHQVDVLRNFLGVETSAEKLLRLEAEIERLRTLLSEAEQREKDVRRLALEEAALWHDEQVQGYTDQIAANDAYLSSVGKITISVANEYCDDQRSTHRRSAAAIRALQSVEARPVDNSGESGDR